MTDKTSPALSRLDICRRFVSSVRHSTELGIEVLEAGERDVRTRLASRPELVGNPDSGILHGGAIFALMDQAGGLANACIIYPSFEITPTIDMRVDHLRAPLPGKAVICDAECYRLSQHVAFVRMTVFEEGDEGGEPVATGLATYMRMKIPGMNKVVA